MKYQIPFILFFPHLTLMSSRTYGTARKINLISRKATLKLRNILALNSEIKCSLSCKNLLAVMLISSAASSRTNSKKRNSSIRHSPCSKSDISEFSNLSESENRDTLQDLHIQCSSTDMENSQNIPREYP